MEHLFGGTARNVFFNKGTNMYCCRNWSNYSTGFGDLDGNFWLGLTHIHRLVSVEPTELHVVLKAFDGSSKYASYGSFSIMDESDNFRLTVSG